MVAAESDATSQSRDAVIEEIVVTAKEREESLTDVPMSIQAASVFDNSLTMSPTVSMYLDAAPLMMLGATEQQHAYRNRMTGKKVMSMMMKRLSRMNLRIALRWLMTITID